MRKSLTAFSILSLASLPAFAQVEELTSAKKQQICDAVALSENAAHDGSKFDPATCLSAEFRIMDSDEAEIEVLFTGKLRPNGRTIECTVYNELPLDRYYPTLEVCNYLD